MARLKSMTLSLPLFMILLLASCFDGPSPHISIEIGEKGPLHPRFTVNYDIRSLSVYHVYGWPQVTVSDQSPTGEPIWRESLIWSMVSRDHEKRVKSLEYGNLPSGYEESVSMPLEANKLYLAKFFVEIGGPSCPVPFWFCILEDESGEVRLIELTWRTPQSSETDKPFNEVKFEIEEGTKKILKIIPVK